MGVFPVRLLQIANQLDAEHELRRMGVDPGGIALMASKMVHRCVHLSRLQCRQANVLKQEMLSLGGDAAVARGTVACSIEATDVILMGTDKQLQLLCSKLAAQPFGLRPIATEIEHALARAERGPRSWQTSRRELSLARPLIMGILNATPDSFSDSSHHFDPQQALDRALEMVEQGVDIIDIGGESTRPGAQPVSEELELQRVVPVIRLLAERVSCPLSVDTWKSAVAQGAMDAGAEIINDISGLTFDPRVAQVASRTGAGVVLMHTRGTLETMHNTTTYRDLLGEVAQELSVSLELALSAGIKPERVVLDPGIGFSKNAEGNLELLRRLRELSVLGPPLLVGTSRKSFIGKALGRDASQRVHGTAATVALAVANGASILRVHDVAEMRDAADMAHAITTGLPGKPPPPASH